MSELVKYRGMIADTFFNVEAISDDDAQRKCLAKLREILDKPGALDNFIVWKGDPDDVTS